MKQITKRLRKGDDLKESIIQIAKEEQITAAVVVCSVGSLSKAKFRLPVVNKIPEYREYDGEMEILSLNGRIAEHGSHAHMHITIGLEDGSVVGGHLVEGCIVNTTAEIVVLSFEDVRYLMMEDKETGYNELKVVKS